MVSLSLLKYLENNGFGTIDENLFWEKMGLGADGLYITDLGGSQDLGNRQSMSYQIYSRAENDVDAYKQLQAVMEFLLQSFGVCQLPAVPPITNYGYKDVTIMPPSTISSLGTDINGRAICSINGLIYYGDKSFIEPPPIEGDYVESEAGQPVITENNKLIITENENG